MWSLWVVFKAVFPIISFPLNNITCLPFFISCQISRRANISPENVHNVIIWGNHSSTQFPDVSHAYIQEGAGPKTAVYEAIKDDAWLKGDFIKVCESILMSVMCMCMYIHWNPFKEDNIGTQRFVLYSKVSLTQGFKQTFVSLKLVSKEFTYHDSIVQLRMSLHNSGVVTF